MAMVPQSGWIFNATVRENILFGNDWDEERYHNVLSAACLDQDLLLFSNGDQTEIGEKVALLFSRLLNVPMFS